MPVQQYYYTHNHQYTDQEFLQGILDKYCVNKFYTSMNTQQKKRNQNLWMQFCHAKLDVMHQYIKACTKSRLLILKCPLHSRDQWHMNFLKQITPCIKSDEQNAQLVKWLILSTYIPLQLDDIYYLQRDIQKTLLVSQKYMINDLLIEGMYNILYNGGYSFLKTNWQNNFQVLLLLNISSTVNYALRALIYHEDIVYYIDDGKHQTWSQYIKHKKYDLHKLCGVLKASSNAYIAFPMITFVSMYTYNILEDHPLFQMLSYVVYVMKGLQILLYIEDVFKTMKMIHTYVRVRSQS